MHDRRVLEVGDVDAGDGQPLERAVGADEVRDEVRGRLAQQLRRGGELLHRAAGAHHGDPVTETDRLLDVVGDEDDGLADLRLQAQELRLQPLAHDRVDGGEGLVHQQHRRVRGQRAGHAGALPLPAGELVRVPVAVRRRVQADELQQLLDPVPGALLVPAEQPRHRGHVAPHRLVREQADVLDHVADPAAQLDRVDPRHVVVAEQDPSGARLDDAVDHLHRGRLAAARRAHQHGQLAGGEGQVQLPDGDGAVGVDLAHAVEADRLRATGGAGAPGILRWSGRLEWQYRPRGGLPGERSVLSGASDVVPLAADAGLNPWFSPSWVIDNWSLIVPLLAQHVRLTRGVGPDRRPGGLPAGAGRPAQQAAGRARSSGCRRWSTRSRPWRCSPSSRPFTGLSETTVAIGLVLYSLVILVRNFLAGLQAVPADAREAARGMGYGRARLLWQVELPLALPSIMTGLRIATVSTVALVTVGVIVGQGGLGQIIIVNGFGANYYRAADRVRDAGLRAARPRRRPAAGAGAAAADAVGADAGGGMNAFGDAIVYLNDPLNWTRPRGIIDLHRPARADRRPRPAHRPARRRPDRRAGWGTPAAAAAPRSGWSNISRAVPTLAILAIFAVTPIGFTIWAPVIALTVFAIPPILANTYVGFREVDRDVVEAARAMGMSERQVVFRAELPLAVPLMMTGIRTAAVQVVATATLAALLGGGTLGSDHPHRFRPAGQRRRRRRRAARRRARRAHRGAARRRRPDRHPRSAAAAVPAAGPAGRRAGRRPRRRQPEPAGARR